MVRFFPPAATVVDVVDAPPAAALVVEVALVVVLAVVLVAEAKPAKAKTQKLSFILTITNWWKLSVYRDYKHVGNYWKQ